MKYSVSINKHSFADTITADDARTLSNTFSETPMRDNVCFDQMFLNKIYRIWHANGSIVAKKATIDILTFVENKVSSLNPTPFMGTRNCCDANGATCAQQIAAGKCVDKCMRDTVGALLYPHLYAKNKQKVK